MRRNGGVKTRTGYNVMFDGLLARVVVFLCGTFFMMILCDEV